MQARHLETLKSFQLNFACKAFDYAPMQWKVIEQTQQIESGFDTDQQSMLATLKADGILQIEQENLSKLGCLIEQLHETVGIPGNLAQLLIAIALLLC